MQVAVAKYRPNLSLSLAPQRTVAQGASVSAARSAAQAGGADSISNPLAADRAETDPAVRPSDRAPATERGNLGQVVVEPSALQKGGRSRCFPVRDTETTGQIDTEPRAIPKRPTHPSCSHGRCADRHGRSRDLQVGLFFNPGDSPWLVSRGWWGLRAPCH
jgi:hypothetical protein